MSASTSYFNDDDNALYENMTSGPDGAWLQHNPEMELEEAPPRMPRSLPMDVGGIPDLDDDDSLPEFRIKPAASSTPAARNRTEGNDTGLPAASSGLDWGKPSTVLSAASR